MTAPVTTHAVFFKAAFRALGLGQRAAVQAAEDMSRTAPNIRIER